MPDQFFQDKKSQKVLKTFYKKAPQAFQRVSAGTLNTQAVRSTKLSQKNLNRFMIIRTPALIKNSVKWKLTSKSRSIRGQSSSTFSLARDRHDGWEAVERGSRTDMTLFTKAGRGGSEKGLSISRARKTKAFTNPSDLGFSSDMSEKDAVNYLQAISRSKSRRRKSFYFPSNLKRMVPGIYKFIGGRVKKRRKGSKRSTLVKPTIKMLSNPNQKPKVRDIGWQRKAVLVVLSDRNMKRYWSENFDRELNKIRIK